MIIYLSEEIQHPVCTVRFCYCIVILTSIIAFYCFVQAEMEMVAAGLEKNLHVAERVHLLYLYRSACTAGNLKTAAEALGLVSSFC